jgi:hypothetical protein
MLDERSQAFDERRRFFQQGHESRQRIGKRGLHGLDRDRSANARACRRRQLHVRGQLHDGTRIERDQHAEERLATDTELALGSDVMATSLQAYALIKVVGKNQGLEALRKDLGTRFVKTPRQVEPKAA